ncbi:hypothetical protein JYT93_00900 [bacterium AH-315-J19]|nr:hypothetical protein [Robiginitomaculum sp.]MBN4058573.1 hypothetical protein [bacterium AH-315-J19]
MTSTLELIQVGGLIQAGINMFGLFDLDPALFIFGLIAVVFGGLNLIEYKRFW